MNDSRGGSAGGTIHGKNGSIFICVSAKRIAMRVLDGLEACVSPSGQKREKEDDMKKQLPLVCVALILVVSAQVAFG